MNVGSYAVDARGRFAVISPHARSIAHLHAFFPESELVSPVALFSAEIWGGWGLRRLSRAAHIGARVTGRRFLCLEDGFLRSIGLGKAKAPPFSIVVDDLGVFYDARGPSRLERLIAEANGAALGAAIRARVVAARLSKYNSQPDRPVNLDRRRGPRILLVDQVRGDHSVAGALADEGAFLRMAQTARAERPDVELLIRPHPDVAAGFRRGHFESAVAGARIVADAVDTHAILDACDEVWTVSSQIGFEALLRGMPVTTFGMPFYAGWGLTDDRVQGSAGIEARARRAGRSVTIDSLAAATLAFYPRYADPKSAQPLDVDEAIDRLIAARAAR